MFLAAAWLLQNPVHHRDLLRVQDPCKTQAACLQAAKTYLERKFEGFESSSLDELIRHALQALAASITDGELTASSCTVVSPPCQGILATFKAHLGGLNKLEQTDRQQGTLQ